MKFALQNLRNASQIAKCEPLIHTLQVKSANLILDTTVTITETLGEILKTSRIELIGFKLNFYKKHLLGDLGKISSNFETSCQDNKIYLRYNKDCNTDLG